MSLYCALAKPDNKMYHGMMGEKQPFINNFITAIREETASLWTLINDTELFLRRYKLFGEYENEFREYRHQLQRFYKNGEVRAAVKEKIVTLRRALRENGYDLKLGSKDLQCFGFKSDDAPLEGFKRLVIFIDADAKVHWITGTDNHGTLAGFLGNRLRIPELKNYSGIHNLWFRWHNNILQICGADSEPKDEYAKFLLYAESYKNYLLKVLAKI